MVKLNKRIYYFVFASGLFVLMLYLNSGKGFAMSLLKHPQEEIVLSSPFEGVITLDHQPVAGAKVVRVLTWFETEHATDNAVTDKEGRFSLPVVKKTLALNKIGEFVVSQEIVVQYDGKEYPIWTKAKWDKGLYGELSGVPENFHCELTDEFKLVEEGKGLLATACQWNGIKQGVYA